MNDEIRLLPCAHCGSPAQFAENENEGLHGMEYIECTNIQCGMATLLMQPIGESVGEKLAEIWNARTSSGESLTLQDDERTVHLVYPLPEDVAFKIASDCNRRIAANTELLRKVLADLSERNTEVHGTANQ